MTGKADPQPVAVRRRAILHVSADVPDLIVPAKTPAIATLIALADAAFDQDIVSINRAGAGWGLMADVLGRRMRVEPRSPTGRTTALTYRAPGRGLFHATRLRALGDWLADRIAAHPRPDLIVGHKLTVEGIAVAQAAARLGIPYALTIQGNTDLKIMAARPDLRPLLARVFHGAAMVVVFAPWALARTQAVLGTRQGPVELVPCAVGQVDCLPPRIGGDGLFSAFHLHNARLKNLHRMASAVDRSGADRLAIGGGGSAEQIAAAQALVPPALRQRVVFEGHVDAAAMPARMNRASGFVMPSQRESFGLVFIESLLAGTPIAYPRGWAVDGYFDHDDFALAVDPGSVEAIAEAMARLLRDEARLKTALAQWQGGDGPVRFATATIARDYVAALTQAMAGAA